MWNKELNWIGQLNNAFSKFGFSLARKPTVHVLIFSSIGWYNKRTNTYRNHFSRSYENRSKMRVTHAYLWNDTRLILVITPNKWMLAGIPLIPFSPSVIRGVLLVHSGHDTCVFCNLANFLMQPSQKVWPHSNSKGMWLPIGLETS